MFTWAREMLLYKNSTDIIVSTAGIEVITGRKWALEAINQAKSWLQQCVLLGSVSSGWAWLLSISRLHYDKD